MSTYHAIDLFYGTPDTGDNARLAEILDAMAAMEAEVLGFLGLTTTYGSQPPNTLPGVYPLTLHYSGRSGVTLSWLTLGRGRLAGFPGGKRTHLHSVEIFLAVGTRTGRLETLQAANLHWLTALDMAYAANASLNGRVKGAKLTSAQWGSITYAETAYYGWIFQALVEGQYTMNGDFNPP